jgi:hypothetical protein
MNTNTKSERNRLIVEAYKRGIPIRYIAETHGISYNRCLYIVNRDYPYAVEKVHSDRRICP